VATFEQTSRKQRTEVSRSHGTVGPAHRDRDFRKRSPLAGAKGEDGIHLLLLRRPPARFTGGFLGARRGFLGGFLGARSPFLGGRHPQTKLSGRGGVGLERQGVGLRAETARRNQEPLPDFGTKGRIDIEIPFNAPADRPCRIFLDDGSKLGGASAEATAFPVVDQYHLQSEAFSRAIRTGSGVENSIEVAVGNMRVIDALFRSADSGGWEQV
jgi:hypothetical protein